MSSPPTTGERRTRVPGTRLSRNLELVERLRKISARYNTSPGAVAIAWTLRQPAVTGAIVGFRSAEQVEGCSPLPPFG